LQLVRFDYVDNDGALHKQTDLKAPLPHLSFGCGIYTFEKLSEQV